MIKEILYHKTVDILVQAYFNDTLEHGNYCGCAVGNMIAANCGINLTRRREFAEVQWNGDGSGGKHWFELVKYGGGHEIDTELAMSQINKTGYTLSEVLKIEEAFESAGFAFYDDDEDTLMFNGLMAVIEVLDQIHQNTDEQLTKTSKQKFVK
jgi:hypothetical protein